MCWRALAGPDAGRFSSVEEDQGRAQFTVLHTESCGSGRHRLWCVPGVQAVGGEGRAGCQLGAILRGPPMARQAAPSSRTLPRVFWAPRPLFGASDPVPSTQPRACLVIGVRALPRFPTGPAKLTEHLASAACGVSGGGWWGGRRRQ